MPRWYRSQERADVALRTDAFSILGLKTLRNYRNVVLLAYLTVEFVVVASLACEVCAESRR